FAKLDFWLKSRLSEFQKRSLLVVNEAFEILSNEELGQKAGFSKDSFNYSQIPLRLNCCQRGLQDSQEKPALPDDSCSGLIKGCGLHFF
ncbi:MAG: hypothetical protein AAGI25_21285, partial [Bacteroidota bacterium]